MWVSVDRNQFSTRNYRQMMLIYFMYIFLENIKPQI
jgi:hypothetical protein